MSEMLEFNNIEGVIFTVEDIESQRERVPFEGEIWTPSRDEAIEAEKKLPTYLKDILAEKYDDYVFYDFPTYIRQYVGVIIQGERCIWINCFCGFFDMIPNYWHFIQTGANPCYLRMVWHPAAQTFSHFISYDEY
jgi:hypothetical protein